MRIQISKHANPPPKTGIPHANARQAMPEYQGKPIKPSIPATPWTYAAMKSKDSCHE
jgi:hypothetical protein